jgi:hypothetical protein
MVVQCYNIIDEESDGPLMQSMVTSTLYSITSKAQARRCPRIALGVSLFLPPISVVSSLLCIWTLLFYLRQRRVFTQNERQVRDPFRGMVYHPEFC